MPRTKKAPPASKETNGAAEHFSDPAAIAKRAYEIYRGRGGQDGGDLDDWLEAERQLGSAPASPTTPPPAKTRKRKDSKVSESSGL